MSVKELETKLKRRNLVSIVFAGLILAPNLSAYPEEPKQDSGREKSPAEKSEENEAYNAIKEYTSNSTTRYIAGIRKIQESLEKAIEKYGYEKMFDVYNNVSLSSLDYARERATKETKKEEDEKKYEEIAKRFTEDMQNYLVDVPVDYSKPEILEGYKKWIKGGVEFYTRLLKKDRGEKDYKKLVSNNISREGYLECISNQNRVFDEIHDACMNSRTGVKGWFAGDTINKVRDFTVKFYEKTIEEIYGKKEPGK